jgi:murein DD-endopeptidase MepM/ murein hydrolase activator NlpD
VLGFVGNTGNAAQTPAHLHFAIHHLSLGGLFGVDPVPVLAHARSMKVARPAPMAGMDLVERNVRPW